MRWAGSRPLLRHHPLIRSFQATINYPSVSIIVTILAASHLHRQPQTQHESKICIQIILYRCQFRDFRCSLMVGSVLGRNLKDRPVFGRKKVEECQCWSKVEVLRTGKNCPPTSSKAGFVRPMRSACPTTSDTPPACRLFHIFFHPWPPQ